MTTPQNPNRWQALPKEIKKAFGNTDALQALGKKYYDLYEATPEGSKDEAFYLKCIEYIRLFLEKAGLLQEVQELKKKYFGAVKLIKGFVKNCKGCMENGEVLKEKRAAHNSNRKSAKEFGTLDLLRYRQKITGRMQYCYPSSPKASPRAGWAVWDGCQDNPWSDYCIAITGDLELFELPKKRR